MVLISPNTNQGYHLKNKFRVEMAALNATLILKNSRMQAHRNQWLLHKQFFDKIKSPYQALETVPLAYFLQHKTWTYNLSGKGEK